MRTSGRCRSAEAILRRFMSKDSNRNINDLLQASRVFESKKARAYEGYATKRGKRWNTL